MPRTSLDLCVRIVLMTYLTYLILCLINFQEVFKSDMNVTIQLKEVLGLCAVMFVKDYFKCKPEGFEDKDIYVCESRYSTRGRSFKKIKVLS